MKIALINGSPADKSHTFALLKYIEQLFKEKNVEVTMWDLRKKPLPVVLPQHHKNPMESPGKNVKQFVKFISDSDGIVLGTPLYHGSYSGVLKNAIDNLAYDAFENKIVGLVTNAGGMRNTLACEHLRSVVRTLYGYSTQTQIGTDRGDYRETEQGYILKNKEIQERCKRLSTELMTLISSFAAV